MSSLIVEVCKIDQIVEHPNADRLEIAVVKGWQTVVGKGQHKIGDECIYIPIDSILPPKLEEYLFPPDSKIKLEKSRVRSIRIRQAVSQGMIITATPELEERFPGILKKKVGEDVAELLGITKFEPPEYSIPGKMRARQITHNNPVFSKYTDIENIKHFPNLFEPEDEIYVTEKVHGTSARYAILPTHIWGLWKRLKKWLHISSKYEFCYGSRNVQLQAKKNLYYAKDVYAIIARQLNIKSLLRPGETLFGEIVGDGIQKGYVYDCGKEEWKFVAYDIKDERGYLSSEAFIKECDARGIPRVPVIYQGQLKHIDLNALSKGHSLLAKNLPIREGIVIKPRFETITYMGRKVLKYLNDDYLLIKDTTDFH